MKTPASVLLLLGVSFTAASINRQQVITQFNPTRYASSNSTPMQIGNGHFAFGADITGLQTFLPFNTLSDWGWHNFSLPVVGNKTVGVEEFTGEYWWTHGRLVNYDQPNPAEPAISNWLIQNPQRLNLGRIGFYFDPVLNITKSSLSRKEQKLDLYSGIITSKFSVLGENVVVTTVVDPGSDTVAIEVQSKLIDEGKLGVFFDYPYSDVNKFDAPFVGAWNKSELHKTSLQQSPRKAQITHEIDATTYYTSISWDGEASILGPENGTHRYVLRTKSGFGSSFDLSVNFSPSLNATIPDGKSIFASSQDWWQKYWESGAFVDLTATSSPNATELQRRIILSQYLLAVNSAGLDSPQESGLVNNGWYGKFHLEMPVWHLGHWARWGKWSLLSRSIPGMYQHFLPTSIQRAKEQGYEGARWGKMSDPTGRSAPGEINSLLIWQQPHVMYFAEMEWRDFPSEETLEKWDELVTRTAEFMVSFAFWNTSTGVYDLGPPMYPVSENTNPNATINPTFELAYWRFGLSIASSWKARQNLPIPANWTHVLTNLAPLPIKNGTYTIYEGIPDMWIDPKTYYDHPAMIGIYGLLPPPYFPVPSFNLTILSSTAAKIAETWDFTQLYGWDFPMLAMNAARLGDPEKAVSYLLDDNYVFDDVGMPVGGPRVATPYMPGSGSLLLAVAMMAGGWDGMDEGRSVWPEGWVVRSEGFTRAM